MSQPKFLSWLGQFDKRSLRPSDGNRRRPLQLEALEDRIVPSDVSLPLQNDTGLGSGYSIWVAGYSTSPQWELTNNNGVGQFQSVTLTPPPPLPPGSPPTTAFSPALPSSQLGPMSSISLDPTQPLSGRIYFFVEPSGSTPPPLDWEWTWNSTTNSWTQAGLAQPTDPPQDTTYPPFAYVEFTVDGSTNDASDIHIDVSQVDGLFFPLTLTQYQGTQMLSQVGQTVSSAVDLQDIIAAYNNLMDSLGAFGQPYLDLVYSNGITGQNGSSSSGIVNPGAFLSEDLSSNKTLNTEQSNDYSTWNTDWAPVVSTLFTKADGGTISLIGPDGDYYQGTPVTLGSAYILKFTGYSDSSLSTKNGIVFNIYDPATPDPSLSIPATKDETSFEIFAGAGVLADSSSNVINLASLPPAPPPGPSITESIGPYVSQGSTVTFTATDSGTPSSVTWKYSPDGGTTWSSKIPGGTFNLTGSNSTLTVSNLTPDATSPGYYEYEAVFTNGGGSYTAGPASLVVYAASAGGNTPTTVVLNLENQIDEALNRGVALNNQQNGVSAGYTSYDWADENTWYPVLKSGDGNYENLFALFEHTATVNNQPLFTLPNSSAKDVQGAPMGQAYGFSFDETPMATPTQTSPANVPSKFDPASSKATSIAITLGPWFPSPLPSPSQTANSSPSASLSPMATWAPPLLFLAEDRFALEVDSMASMFSNDPLFTQAADRAMSVVNSLLHLDNPALFTGLSGLQSAIDANPYFGTMLGMVGQGFGFDWADHSKDWGPWTVSVGHIVQLELALNQFAPLSQS